MIWKDIDKRHELYMDTINTSDRIDEHPPVLIMCKSDEPDEEDQWYYTSEFLGVEVMNITADDLDDAKYWFACMVRNRLSDGIDWREDACKEIENYMRKN